MINRKIARQKRHWRIRKKIHGTSICPRLAVFVSNKNFYAQIIDDDKQCTLIAYSSLNLELQKGNSIEIVKKIATKLAETASIKKITKVVLDRGGFLFHGKIKAFTEILKSKGIKV